MKFRLILKQSYKDFLSKKVLYATFTAFLFIAMSLVMGLFSFFTIFTSENSNIMNGVKMNASTSSFVFGSKNNEDEEVNFNDDGRFYNYVYDLISEEYVSTIDDIEADIDQYIDVIGKRSGTLLDTVEEGGIKNSNDVINDIIASKIGQYSRNVLQFFFLNTFKEEFSPNYFFNNYLDRLIDVSTQKSLLTKVAMAERWMYETDEEWNNVNPLLKADEYNKMYIDEMMDMSTMNRDDFKNKNFVFLSPKFMRVNGYKVGEYITYKVDGHNVKSVIAGVAMDRSTFMGKGDGYMLLPHENILTPKVVDKNGTTVTISESLNIGNIWFYKKESYDGEAQDKLDKAIGDMFTSKDGKPYFFGTDWKKYNQQNSVEIATMMFTIMVFGIGLLILFLLFMVFYFITIQFIQMQSKNLFFLKSMGVNNRSLSLMTTLSMAVPLILSAVLSIFGSMLVSGIMFKAVSFEMMPNWPLYAITWQNILILIALFAVMMSAFFLINHLIITGGKLTLANINKSTGPSKMTMKFKTKINFLPSKALIGVSFTLKNIYKNVITLILLTLTFSSILFSVQFVTSAKYNTSMYERANAPYKSIKFETELSPIAQFGDGEWRYTFDSIDQEDFDGMAKNSLDDTVAILSTFANSLSYQKDGQVIKGEVDIRDYYVSSDGIRDFAKYDSDAILKVLNMIPENGPEVEILKNFIEENSKKIDDINFELNSQLESLDYEFSKLSKDANKAEFNILFGKNLINRMNKSYFSTKFKLAGGRSGVLITGSSILKDDYKFLLPEISKNKNLLQKENILDNKTGITSKQDVLPIEVSTYFAQARGLKRGSIIQITLPRLLSGINESTIINAKVIDIQKSNPISNEIYANKEAVFKYLYENTPVFSPAVFPENENAVKYSAYKQMYEHVTNERADGFEFNNSVYSYENMPINLKYLTIPMYNNSMLTVEGTNVEIENSSDINDLGKSILNYYDIDGLQSRLNSITNNVMIFDLVTANAQEMILSYLNIINQFILILAIMSISICSILIFLILKENKEVILLFKAIGYRRREINGYLLWGYYFSTIVAVVSSILISKLMIYFVSPLVVTTLRVALNFRFTFSFALIAVAMAFIFIFMITLSINVFSTRQKAKDAFNTL
ncbi:FtsX-like permease family protein [[Acholeplasma] multilocale]|uniref:FtsX-like permease family protein n=1 Tax=[Acholeplasma] multilocale TaxID=264638 RepID=UPI00047BBE38|nr:ABC transporter permease [[Acholeplasma] multilocale]